MACWTLPVAARFPILTRIAKRSADWEVAKSGGKTLGGLKPRQFPLEIETQLRALILGQTAGHLREDGTIERGAFSVPRNHICRPRLGENLVQLLANLVGIGVIDRGLEIVVRRVLPVVSE